MFSAVLSTPSSLASFVFVPDYWDPKRIIPFEIGPEDMIFSFSTGGIIWLMIMSLFFRNIRVDINWRITFKRYISILIVGSAIYLLWLSTGINIMIATVLTVSIIGLWIIHRNKDYWPICAIGMAGFVVFYASFLKAFFILFPEFSGHWNGNNLFGIYILGLPLEEVIWGAAFGAVWPLIIAYLLDIHLIKKVS